MLVIVRQKGSVILVSIFKLLFGNSFKNFNLLSLTLIIFDIQTALSITRKIFCSTVLSARLVQKDGSFHELFSNKYCLFIMGNRAIGQIRLWIISQQINKFDSGVTVQYD